MTRWTFWNQAIGPRLLAAALSAGSGLPATAGGAPGNALDAVTITGQGGGAIGLMGVADAASEGTVSARQLATRPLLRPAEVMEAVPGMTVTQHSGDGKANQYFLRGFNLDHGSDFATSVMGMPVNMASHGHGQGYMDLNFLIPELIGSVRYHKGVYAVADGDFATTGSARIDYQRSLPASLIDLGVGAGRHRRWLTAGSTALGEGLQLLAGLELAGNDGPWDQPERLRKHNGVLRLSAGSASNGFALSAMGYHAQWVATEHVPERAITRGEIGRYGALLGGDGGNTHRYSLSGEWARSDERQAQRASAYLVDYALDLFSNPSGFVSGPQGDQHEQVDQRVTRGGQVLQTWFLGPDWRDTDVSLGLQLRQDRIGKLGLYSTVDRQRTGTVREDRVDQTSWALYGEARSAWTPWLRSVLGLRRDALQADVTPRAGEFNTANGGHAQGRQWSPKLGLVIGPFKDSVLDKTEFYANWGSGFHSNDARGVTARVNPGNGEPVGAVPALVKASGGELGLRSQLRPGWTSSLVLWRLTLGSELVFIGDAGVTEPRGASRRVGLEWSHYITPNDWAIVDADLAWSRARFREPVNGGREVPNAIPLSASLGLAADPHGAWFGGLRLRYVGRYALEETGSEKSHAALTANLKLGWRHSPRLQFTLDVLNLVNRRANDIDYWGGACTRSDGPGCNKGEGIDGRLVHPMEPRTLRLAARLML